MALIDFKYFFNWTGRYANIASSCLRSRFVTKTPFIFSHSVTHACNSHCKTCGRWRFSHLARTRDLTTKQIFKLYDDAADMGMRGYYAFGGEPMVRSDIVELLKHAHDLGMIVVLNTNGYSVAKRAKELADCVDFCYISIDAPDEQHDFIRGRKGSFKEAVEAVKAISDGIARVTIVSVVSKLNFHRMEEMAQFADKLGVGLEFNTVDPSPTDPHNKTRLTKEESHALSPEQLHQFYVKLLELKQNGYHIMDAPKVLEEYIEGKPWGCHFPKIFCYISPDGYFVPCTYNAGLTEPVDFTETPMKEFFQSEEYHEHVRLAESCNECLRPCMRMYSYAFDFFNPFKLRALTSTIKTFKSSNRESLWDGVFKPAGK